MEAERRKVSTVGSTRQTDTGERRAELTPGDIVAATRDLISRVGTKHVSMRRLAGELNVTATALYHHFEDKQKLLELTAESIVAELAGSTSAAGPWTERLRDLLHEQNRILQRYPGVARQLMEFRDSPAALQWSELFFSLLLEAGFTGEAAVRAFGSIAFYINPMFLLDDAPRLGREVLSVTEPLAERVQGHVDEYPALASVADEFARLSFDELYAAGIESLVDGLATELAAQQGARGSGRPKPRLPRRRRDVLAS